MFVLDKILNFVVGDHTPDEVDFPWFDQAGLGFDCHFDLEVPKISAGTVNSADIKMSLKVRRRNLTRDESGKTAGMGSLASCRPLDDLHRWWQ